MAIRRSATKRHGLPSIVQLRLTPTSAQADALAAAVLLCDQAATVVSRLAWQHRTFAVVELHRAAATPRAGRSGRPRRATACLELRRRAVSSAFVVTPGADWAYAIAAGLRHRTVLPAVGGLLIGHLAATAAATRHSPCSRRQRRC
ncbi:hypothetical protein [Nonomuraea sp. NPDC049158]|uniref:hypothetical protein n=1 Tax=Nonomuraea sp. NPDC049158 TaxID=3155649 RepID=UPI0033F6B834